MSEWTVDTLKAYVDAVLVERDKAIAEFKVQTAAKDAARNEIQQAMKDQGLLAERAVNSLMATLMPRAEALAAIHRNEVSIAAATTRINEMHDRGSGMKDGWGYLVGFIGLLALLYSVFHK